MERTFNRPGCQDIKVRVSTNLGCETVKSYPCALDVWPVPDAGFTYSPLFPSTSESTVNIQSTAAGARSWEYWINGLAISTQENFSHAFSDSGNYELVQVVANSQGCMDTISYQVDVSLAAEMFIPTGFTPNGDNLNDLFGPVAPYINPEGYKMSIYNRWGNLVFETTSPTEFWNGKYNNSGKNAQSGTYAYRILYKIENESLKFIDGEVNLIR